MTFQTIRPWIIRGLALLGALAIILFIVNIFINPIGTRTSSFYMGESLGQSTAADSYVKSMASQAMPAQENAVMSRPIIQPSPELLYDEDIDKQSDQKVIKNGSLDLIVDHADETLTQIKTIVVSKKGYIQYATTQEHSNGTKSGFATVRVPEETFDTTIVELKALALIVTQESVNSDDVTEQYIDLAARLKNAQLQEVRYTEILQVAKTVEEMIKVETALANVRSTIESLTGQIQYLDSQTNLSTITLSLSEEPVVTVGGKEFRPGTTIKEAAQTVVALAQWLVEAVIWVAIVGVGVGVPLLFLGWLLWKGVQKIRAQMKR
ncbi:TPA: hypothetical protein DCW61_03130 [Candidatus Uhrbacteria bacterium]|nr:hypothetical protein [Candidatus Uhrbacteria bacterium]